MTDLVFLQRQQALTTSLKVAEYFGKRHDNVLQLIERCKNDLLNFKGVENAIFETIYTDAKGERRPMYLLNRDGFTFVVMGFTGKKAAEFKWNYIQAFNAMEAKLAEINSAQWQEARLATKTGFKKLAATVQKLARYAAAHGSKTPEKLFYSNFARLINKQLGINPKSRDTLAHWQLYEIDRLQAMADIIVNGLLAKGADYHQPYKDCKDAFETYARVSFIPQRLQSA